MKSSLLFKQQVSRFLATKSFSYFLSCLFVFSYESYQFSVKYFSSKQPPDYVLKEAKNTNKFFKCVGSVHNLGNGGTNGGFKSAYMALTEEEFEAVSNSCFTFQLNKNIKRVSIENQDDKYISG